MSLKAYFRNRKFEDAWHLLRLKILLMFLRLAYVNAIFRALVFGGACRWIPSKFGVCQWLAWTFPQKMRLEMKAPEIFPDSPSGIFLARHWRVFPPNSVGKIAPNLRHFLQNFDLSSHHIRNSRNAMVSRFRWFYSIFICFLRGYFLCNQVLFSV